MAEPTPKRIMEIGMGFMPSKVLLTAVELRLFTKLAREPGDLHSLQARLGLHPRSARDFLDTLVSLGLLERDGGIYRNTADTDLFLDAAKPSYAPVRILESLHHSIEHRRAAERGQARRR